MSSASAPARSSEARSIPKVAAEMSRQDLIMRIGRVIQEETYGENSTGAIGVGARRAATIIVDQVLSGFHKTAIEASR